MGDLTARIMQTATAPPTDDALAVMRLSLLDWIACGLAGRQEPVAGIVAGMLDAEGGVGTATGFDGVTRTARATALYNGTVSHALDYDDTHFAHIGHVSVGVLPAALACAEVGNLTIGQFLNAALAGSEASIRMGLALGRAHYEVGFHQTATAGAFGATLAAALITTPDTTIHGHALGLASTRAAGLKSQFGTMGKPYNAGLAGQTAIEAVQLAVRGMTSDPDGWDGPRGFIATHHGAGDIGPDGFMMPQVSHKFHACCHGLHAALDAVETLKPVDAAQIAAITIKTHPRWMSVCNQQDPRTGLAAKFSYRAVMAFSLRGHTTAALETFDDHLVNQDDVRALMGNITVVADAALSEMQAEVTITLRDATACKAASDLDAPQPIAVRQRRVIAKAEALIGAETVSACVSRIADDAAPVRALTALWNA